MSNGRFFVSTSECSAKLSERSDRAAAFSGPLFPADELFCNGRILPIKPSAAVAQKTPFLNFEHRSNDTQQKQRGRRGYLWRNKKESRNRCEATSLSPRRNSFSHWGGKGNGQRNDGVIHNSAEEEEFEGIKIVGPASSSTLLKPRGSRRKWSLTDFIFRRCKSEGEKLERDEMELSFSSYARMSLSSDNDEERASAQGKADHAKKMSDTTTNRTASISSPNRMGVPASAQKLHRVPSPNRRVAPASAHEFHRVPSPNRRGVPASAHELHYISSPKRRGVPVSAHELHYTANRAQAEELRRKTFLPYKQGVLGCLRFSSPPASPQGSKSSRVIHASGRLYFCTGGDVNM